MVFSKLFLGLCFLTDRREPLPRSVPRGKCTKPGEYIDYGLQNRTLRPTILPGKQRWLRHCRSNLSAKDYTDFFFFQAGRLELHSEGSWHSFLMLFWPRFLYILVSCWQGAQGIPEWATGLEKGLHFLDVFLWDGIQLELEAFQFSIHSFFVPAKGIHQGVGWLRLPIPTPSSLQLASQCRLFCPLLLSRLSRCFYDHQDCRITGCSGSPAAEAVNKEIKGMKMKGKRRGKDRKVRNLFGREWGSLGVVGERHWVSFERECDKLQCPFLIIRCISFLQLP